MQEQRPAAQAGECGLAPPRPPAGSLGVSVYWFLPVSDAPARQPGHSGAVSLPDSRALHPAMGTSSAVLCILFFCGALGQGRLGVLWGSGRGSWKSLRAGEGV